MNKENQQQIRAPRSRSSYRWPFTIAYATLAVLILFQNCSRKGKESPNNSDFTISSLSGAGLSDQVAVVGQKVTLVVSYQNLPSNAVYVWEKDGGPFGSTTSNSLSIASVHIEDQGVYRVRVMSGLSTLIESQATLTVVNDSGTQSDESSGSSGDSGSSAKSAPNFLQSPEDLTVSEGTPVSLVSLAEGTPSPNYQWQKDGADIPGATEATLELGEVTPEDSGTYQVVASNPDGSSVSEPAALVVNELPKTCTVEGITFLVGQSLIGQCIGACQDKDFVGTRTIHFCNDGGTVTTSETACNGTFFQRLACKNN